MGANEGYLNILIAEIWDEEKARACFRDTLYHVDPVTNKAFSPLHALASVPFNEEKTRFFYDRHPEALYMTASFPGLDTPVSAAIRRDNVQLLEYYLKRESRVRSLTFKGHSLASYAVDKNAKDVCVFLVETWPEMFDEQSYGTTPLKYARRKPEIFEILFKKLKCRMHLPHYDVFLHDPWCASRAHYPCREKNCVRLAKALLKTRTKWPNMIYACAPAFEYAVRHFFETNKEALRGLLVDCLDQMFERFANFKESEFGKVRANFITFLNITQAIYTRDVNLNGETVVHMMVYRRVATLDILQLIADIDPLAFFISAHSGHLLLDRYDCDKQPDLCLTLLSFIRSNPRVLLDTRSSDIVAPWISSKILLPHAQSTDDYLRIYRMCPGTCHYVLQACPQLIDMTVDLGVTIGDLALRSNMSLIRVYFAITQHIDLDAPTTYGRSLRLILNDTNLRRYINAEFIENATAFGDPERRKRVARTPSMVLTVYNALKFAEGKSAVVRRVY